MNFRAENIQVFRLQPWVKGAQIADKEPDTPAKIDTEEERRMKQRLLTDRYGTKGAIGKVYILSLVFKKMQ